VAHRARATYEQSAKVFRDDGNEAKRRGSGVSPDEIYEHTPGVISARSFRAKSKRKISRRDENRDSTIRIHVSI